MPRFTYDRNLKAFSRANKKNQTESEKRLWHHLRRNVHGCKFRRQFPVDNFILDFYCPEKKLAIELDGGQHRTNKTYDNYRTYKLAQRGIRVIRFWDSDIFNNLSGVLETIIKELNRVA